jgi:hypothetical protein
MTHIDILHCFLGINIRAETGEDGATRVTVDDT